MATFEFNFVMQVHCKDMPCGKLVKLVIDPEPQVVTELIVEKGLLFKHDRVLPLAAVERVTEDAILLNLHSAELNNYPEYREVEVKEPAPEASTHVPTTGLALGYGPSEPTVPLIRKRLREGIAADKAVIDRGTEVRNLEKVIGHVDRLIANRASGHITHLVMRKGLLATHLLLTEEMIDEVGTDGVYVSVRSEEVDTLPHYTPRREADMLADVWMRLQEADPPVFIGVQPAFANGDLHLIGFVRSPAIRLHAEEIARMVPGVFAVQNELAIDDATDAQITVLTPEAAPFAHAAEITQRICAALAADARTKDAVVEVVAEHGVITLLGQVESATVRNAVEALAAKQTGVTTVINELMIMQRA